MNINMANSPLTNFLPQRNIMERFNRFNALNLRENMGLTNAGEKLGVDVSISEEMRVMLKELSIENNHQSLLNEAKGLDEDEDNDFIVNRAGRHDDDYVRIEVEHQLSNHIRLLNAFHGHENHLRDYSLFNSCFNRLAAYFEGMVEDLKATYSGAELEAQLELLDADFERTMQGIAESIASILIARAFYGQELPEDLARLFGGELIGMLKNIDWNSPSAGDAVNAFADSAAAFMMSKAEQTMQIIREGGSVSAAEENN